jgi:hypothetical protein
MTPPAEEAAERGASKTSSGSAARSPSGRESRLGDPSYEDVLAYLIAEAWRASEQYDPERDSNRDLAGFV